MYWHQSLCILSPENSILGVLIKNLYNPFYYFYCFQVNRHSFIYSDGDENSSGFKDDDLSTEPDEDESYHDNADEPLGSPSFFDTSIGPIFSWNDALQPYDANDSKLAVFDAAMSPKMKERLQHIINEMISTEDDYVTSLEYVLRHYFSEMDGGEGVPAFLLGKKNVLFGNIERL